MKAQIEKVCTTSTHMGEKSKPEFVRVESQYFTKLGNEQNDQSGAADKSLCGECHTRMTPGLRQSDGRTDCGQYEVYDNECEESYFVQKSLRPYHSHNNPRQRNTNPLDDFGNPQSCRYCKSIYHFLNDCPDAPPRTSTVWRGRNARGGSFRGRSRGGRGGPAKQEDRKFWLVDIALLCDFDDDNLDALLGETIGMAILDSGCTRTVCSNMWLNSYLDTLSSGERKSVYSTDSDIKFRFGDGKVFSSSRAVHIPVHVGSTSATLTTQVIDANIPLLTFPGFYEESWSAPGFHEWQHQTIWPRHPLDHIAVRTLLCEFIKVSGQCKLPWVESYTVFNTYSAGWWSLWEKNL